MRSICLAIVLSLVAGAVQAAPAPPLSKREARTMSTQALKRRVLDQLGDILVETPRPANKTPKAGLRVLSFTTRPHPTELDDVCASETLIVRFTTTSTRHRANADTPARVTSLDTNRRFHIADGKPKPCARLDPQRDLFVNADDPWQARAAARLLPMIRAAAGDKASPILECQGACPDGLKTVTVENIDSVSAADVPWDRPQAEKAITIATGTLDLKIVYAETADVLTLRKVRVTEVVTFADLLID